MKRGMGSFLAMLVASAAPVFLQAEDAWSVGPYGAFFKPAIAVSLEGNTADLGIEHDSVVLYTSKLLDKAGIPSSVSGVSSPYVFEVYILATQLFALDNPERPMNSQMASLLCRACRYADGGAFVFWENHSIAGAVNTSPSLLRAQLQSHLESMVQQFAIMHHQSQAQ